MAFCRRCGNRLAEDSNFCNSCGTPVDTPPVPHEQHASVRRSGSEPKELMRVGGSNKAITMFVFSIIAIIIQGFVMASYFNGQIEDMGNISGGEEQEYAMLKLLRNGLLILYAILIFEFIMKIIQVRKNNLVLTEEGVSGEACPLYGFGTIYMRKTYKEIRGVDVKMGTLIIHTWERKFYFSVENADGAAYKIRQLL